MNTESRTEATEANKDFRAFEPISPIPFELPNVGDTITLFFQGKSVFQIREGMPIYNDREYFVVEVKAIYPKKTYTFAGKRKI